MRKFVVLLLTSIYLLLNTNSLAISSPTNLSPADGSTTSSNTLSWSAVSSAAKYRVLLDTNNPPTSSTAFRDYYPVNNQYSPTGMSSGTIYYWKVEAYDGSTWSPWTNIQSFTFSSSPPISTPTPTTPQPTNTPTPVSSPTTAPTPTTPTSSSQPTLTSSPTPTTSTSPSFTISASQLSINSSNSFSVAVNLTSLAPNSHFYLKGAFQKSGSSNYFGQTQINNSWVKNSSNFTNQLSITTNSSGNFSGNLTVMPDTDDSGFTGSSDYMFKVGRYSETGSGPTWSNPITVTITDTSAPLTGASSLGVTPTLTPTPTPTPKSFFSSIASSLGFGGSSHIIKIPDNLTASTEASIAGVASQSSQSTEIASAKSAKSPNYLLLASGVAFLLVSTLVFYAWRKYRL